MVVVGLIIIMLGEGRIFIRVEGRGKKGWKEVMRGEWKEGKGLGREGRRGLKKEDITDL